MSNMSNNPNNQSHKSTATDTSLNESVTAGGAGYWGSGETISVTSSGNKIASRADGALWDTIAGAYVAIQNTNIGTTAVPKNGQ